MITLQLPTGHRLVHFEAIDSTNAEAHRLAASGGDGPLWIWSDVQTAGRGRLGRHWDSRRGNLFVTFLFTPQVSAPVVSQLGLVAALAVHDAAVAATGSAKIQIKWPNDLLIDGAKFCGILAEVLGEGRVGIGIGVNLAHAPEDAPYAVAALGAGNPAAFLQQLMGALVNRLAQWSNGEGFAATRQDWMARALGVGEAVCSGELHGLFKGLAADGALVVQSASGDEKHVHAGEVRFSSLERIRNDKR